MNQVSTAFSSTNRVSLSYQQGGAGGGAIGNLSAIPVSISSFSGALLALKSDKRPGMERVNLLHEEDPSPSSPKTPEDNGGGFLGSLNK